MTSHDSKEGEAALDQNSLFHATPVIRVDLLLLDDDVKCTSTYNVFSKMKWNVAFSYLPNPFGVF